MRFVRALAAAALLAFPLVATAATDLRILFDTDNRVSTGCVMSGIAGVELSVTTSVETSGTPRVTSLSSQRCTSGAPGAVEVIDNAGWPATFNATTGEFSVETSVLSTLFGGSIPQGMRLGFVAVSGSSTVSLLETPDGSPILFPLFPGHRRSVGNAERTLAADGNDADWDGIDPLVFGSVQTGTPSLRFVSVQAAARAGRLLFRFLAQANADAPTAANDSYTTTPASSITIPVPGVLSNDTDPRGRPLTAILQQAPNHGALVLNADGSFNYVHDGSGAQRDHFLYRASNGSQQSNIARVDIGIGSRPNRRPVSVDDAYSIGIGGALTIPAPGVLTNDSDPDSDPLTALIGTLPAHGILTLSSNGSFTYIHDGVSTAADSFTYFATDGIDQSRETTVQLTIQPNLPPIATGDVYAVAEGGTLTVPRPGVLANDTDVDSPASSLRAILVVGPSSGTLTLNSTGDFTYVHNGSEVTSDSFTYRASDGRSSSNTVTVTISITAVNDAPAAANDSYTTTEDTALTVAAPGVLANDSDPEVSPLSASVVTGPANGTLTLNANGSFTYTPNPNFSGADSFTYRASDGTLSSAPATVSITVTAVNDLPAAAADAYVTNEDAALVVPAPGVLANDTDVESNLTAVLVSGPANGTLTLNGDGSFNYTPGSNFNGADSFTYRASDGTADSSTVTVSITVTAVNDAPVAVADSYTTTEDTPLAVPAPGVIGNDSDVEGSALTAVLVTGPANGALTLNANGSFTYTPNTNFSGTDSFTYRANDGTAQSVAPATVTITVTAVNDAPVAAADSYVTPEDTALTVPAPGTLGNDLDADGNVLTALLVTGVANGTLTLNSNGGFTYTPNVNYFGADSFTYKANDGTVDSNIVSVAITVSSVNDAPVAVNDAYGTAEDTPLVVPAPGVLVNDTDLEGSPLTAVLVAGPANGTLTLNANGSFNYQPNPNFNGTDGFTYQANDGTGNSNVATVTISVSAVSDAPTAGNDAYTVNEDGSLVVAAPGVLSNDADPDGDPITAVLVTGPVNGTLSLSANGGFAYTPNPNYNGADSFTYNANDGALNTLATVSITVTAVNDAPVAVNDVHATDEDVALIVAAPGVLGNDTDTDAHPLTAVLVAGPSNGSLALNANGSFTYTPAANFNGTDTFTYRANDGTTGSNVATVTITVNGLNDAPAAADDSYGTSEDVALVVAAPGVMANDADVDGTPIVALLVTGPTRGVLTFNADGSFSYTPNANLNGPDSFTYRVNDGTLPSNIATVTITVSAVNDAPAAAADAYMTFQSTPLNVAAPGVLANDSDLEGSALTAGLVTGPANGTLALNANGGFVYTPTAGYSGPDSFVYRANDGSADSPNATVSITVSPNSPPVAAADAYAVNEDVTLTVAAPGVLANDSDSDLPAQPLTAVLIATTTNGALTLNANGGFTYIPAPDFQGSDTFQYAANDGVTNGNTVTVTITVNSVSDAPVLSGAGSNRTFTEGDPALALEAAIAVADVDSANLASATVTISAGFQSGVDTLSFTPVAGITGGFAAGVLTFTGSAPVSDYQTVLRSVTFENNSQDPTAGSRTITWVVNDGALPSAGVTTTVNVVAVNDAPVMLNTGSALNYTENGAPAQVDPAAGVFDGDNVNLAGATVQITANYVNGQDVLSYVTALGITGVFDAASGRLTLSGSATVANYQTALRNVLYNNTSENPSMLPRSVTWIANDGSAANNLSIPVVTAVNVAAINDEPVPNAVGPLAVQAGVPVTFAAGTLGGTDVDGGTVTVSTTPGTVANGTVTINADGSFTFTASPASAFGTASFQYNVCDTGNPPSVACSTAPATVTLNVLGPAIYFVKATGSGTACTLGNECTLAAAVAQIGASPNARIFISDNGVQNTIVPLNAGGWLIGQGVTGPNFDTVLGINYTGTGTMAARPAINQPRPTVSNEVRVNTNTVVRGLDVSVGSAPAISETVAGAISNVVINDAALLATGAPAIVLSDVSVLAVNVSSLTSSNSISSGLSLTNVTGLIIAPAGSLTNSTQAVILINGGTVGITYSANVSQANNAPLMSVTNHAGTLTFQTGTVSATNGTGLQFVNADGIYSFNGTNTLAGGDAGIDIAAGTDAVNGSQGTWQFSTNSSITNPSGLLVDIQGSKPNFTYSGNFTKTNGGTGIQALNNTGGFITFSGSPTTRIITTSGANNAVHLNSNTGATMAFGGGNLVLTTATGIGFNATNGGNVLVSGGGNTITSVGGAAVNIQNTTISVSNVMFERISANGGANGIVLNNTGTLGGLIVTGVGTTAGSGGTIQNTTTRGASFISARNISLSNMNFTNAATVDAVAGNTGLSLGNNLSENAAIHLQTVTNVTLDRLVMNGSQEEGINGHNVTNFSLTNSTLSNLGNNSDEDGLHFFNMLGTNVITNTTIASSGDDNVNIQNNSGTSTITITGGSFNTGVLGSGLLFGPRGTTNTTINITGVTCNNNFSGGIVADASDTATMVIDVGTSTLTNNNDGISISGASGNVRADLHNNTINSNDFAAIAVLKAAFSVGGSLDALIRNNTIAVANGRPTDALSLFQAGGGALRLAITSNNISYAGTQRAILLQGGQDGNGSIESTITGNNIDIQLDGVGNAVAGILAQTAITGPGNTTSLCADIGGAAGLRNVFTHSLGGVLASGDIRVRQRMDGTVRLPGYGGAAMDTAAVIAYITGRNTIISATTATADSTGFAGGGACTQPTFP